MSATDEFSHITDKALLAELRERIADGAIDVDDIQDLAPVNVYGGDDNPIEDENALDEARHCLQRRNYPDTLYNLEKALGRPFLGLADLELRAPS